MRQSERREDCPESSPNRAMNHCMADLSVGAHLWLLLISGKLGKWQSCVSRTWLCLLTLSLALYSNRKGEGSVHKAWEWGLKRGNSLGQHEFKIKNGHLASLCQPSPMPGMGQKVFESFSQGGTMLLGTSPYWGQWREGELRLEHLRPPLLPKVTIKIDQKFRLTRKS